MFHRPDFALRRLILAQRLVIAALIITACLAVRAAPDQAKPGEPTDPKARKTFAGASDWQRQGAKAIAMEEFRKANKQDGGRCAECLSRAYTLAKEIGDYKDAANIARDWLAQAQTDADRTAAHFRLAMALQWEGASEKSEKRDKCFSESCDEFKSALAVDPAFFAAHFGLGVSLAYLRQDDAARTEFSTFVDQDNVDPVLRQRAARYVARVELARARMAPPFELTTLDGQHISMDSLAGKVVLIDFWATWCGPCREYLPAIREIARKFQGQPFVAISVSLDSDQQKWKDFVTTNEMTWLQYRDGGFKGPMATLFGVTAIPATFSIDADGVLEDQHVGDAAIEGKLKKMIAHAVEIQSSSPPPAAANRSSGSGAAGETSAN